MEANSQKTGTAADVLAALEAQGLEVLKGKGGFWIRNEGHITLAQARKRTGIAAPKRQTRERVAPYGDAAWIMGINRISR